MKPCRPALLLALAFTASGTVPLRAAKDAPLQPVLAKPGELIHEDRFVSPSLAPPWNVAKGDWQVKEGVLTGREKASDKHPGVLILTKPNRNSIARFSFRLDGAKVFDLSLNHAKGHLFRVMVDRDGISLNKDRDKKDPKSKGQVLAEAGTKFPAGQWFTMLVEIKGDKVSVQTDNGAKIQGAATGLDVEKTGYRFVVRGESVSLADLKVWRAE